MCERLFYLADKASDHASKRAPLIWMAVLLVFAAGASTNAAGATRTAPPPRWAIVFQHVDQRIGDVIGFDILRSGGRHAHALTRRPPGAHDWDNSPVWSPDGQRVAFARFYSHWGLYIVSAAGGTSRRLARGVAGALAWSPDGTRIAFSRSCGRGSAPCRPGIYVAYLDGSRLKRVFPLAGPISWAPNGSRLLCLCAKAIYVFGADGSGRRRLILPGTGQLGRAAWSPDGRLIAFEHHCKGTRGPHDVSCDVAFMDADGGAQTTHHSPSPPLGVPDSDTPSWLADGNLLVADWSVLQIIAIDPRTEARRVLYDDVGWNLTPGPGDEFALLTESSNQRVTLVIADRAGHPLVRRVLPIEGVPSDVSLHTG